MHSHSLIANIRDTIRICLRCNLETPDWNGIADAFKTIHIIVRNIYKKIREEIILGTSTILSLPGLRPLVTTEIEEAVTYLVGAVPIIYQDEITKFIYDLYTI